MASTSTIPHLKLNITEESLTDHIERVVNLVRKHWDFKMVQSKTFSGTMNKLIGCYIKEENDMILIRIKGQNSEVIVNSKTELKYFKLLNEHGLAPDILCTFENGYCYSYIIGRVLKVEELKNTLFVERCAKLTAKFHDIPLESNLVQRSEVFHTIKKYKELIPQIFTSQDLQIR